MKRSGGNIAIINCLTTNIAEHEMEMFTPGAEMIMEI
jgi:hypothetical protein